MRLTPQSIFVGIVALGLPFAVALGWSLGSPGARFEQPPAAGVPGGSGTIGAAPARGSAEPVNQVRFDVRQPATPASTVPSAPAPPPAAVPTPSGSATPVSPIVTLTGVPPLTDPPIPAPTQGASEPPPSSAAPTGTETTESGLGGGLLRPH